jgi:hypothetical protein
LRFGGKYCDVTKSGTVHSGTVCDYVQAGKKESPRDPGKCSENLDEWQERQVELNEIKEAQANKQYDIDKLQKDIDWNKESRDKIASDYMEEQRKKTTEGGCIQCQLSANGGVYAPRKPEPLEIGANFLLAGGAMLAGNSQYKYISDNNARGGYATQPNPGALYWGFPFLMNGIYGAIGSGLGQGGFGCMAGMNGGGNQFGPNGMMGPYGMNGMGGMPPFGYPQGMLGTPGGGGMYMPGYGPWGGAGPWGLGGNAGMGMGNPFGGGFGGGLGMGNPYGMGGFNPYGGMGGGLGGGMGMGNPFGMGGMGGGMGMGNPFGMGGMGMGNPFGMMNPMMGGMGMGGLGGMGGMGGMNPYGMGGMGMGSPFGGMGGMGGVDQSQMQYQMQMMQFQMQQQQQMMEMQRRKQENYIAQARVVQSLSQELYTLQYRLQQAQAAMQSGGSFGFDAGISFGGQYNTSYGPGGAPFSNTPNNTLPRTGTAR